MKKRDKMLSERLRKRYPQLISVHRQITQVENSLSSSQEMMIKEDPIKPDIDIQEITTIPTDVKNESYSIGVIKNDDLTIVKKDEDSDSNLTGNKVFISAMHDTYISNSLKNKAIKDMFTCDKSLHEYAEIIHSELYSDDITRSELDRTFIMLVRDNLKQLVAEKRASKKMK